MQTKLAMLLDLIASDNWNHAIRFAAKFPRLGDQRDVILRAKDALLQPEFYRQLGRDPSGLVEAGKQAILSKFGHRLQEVVSECTAPPRS
jgi:hypothetical protein